MTTSPSNGRMGRNPFAAGQAAREEKSRTDETREARRSRALDSRFCGPVRAASVTAATIYVIGLKTVLLSREVFGVATGRA